LPRPYWDPDTEEVALTLELAVPLLEDAAGGHVEGIVGESDPFLAVKQALERFDEVIVSTLPEHVSHWLRRDLPHRIKQLGVPVTVVTAKRSERPISGSTQRRDLRRSTCARSRREARQRKRSPRAGREAVKGAKTAI
jgi:hypothetical protein